MSDEIQRGKLSRTSPLKKASYVAVFAGIGAVALPFAFGINTFSWIGSWVTGNWPRLIIGAVLVGWVGKSHLS